MIRLFVGLILIIVSAVLLGATLAVHKFGTRQDADKARIFSPISSVAGAAGAWLLFNGLDVITSD